MIRTLPIELIILVAALLLLLGVLASRASHRLGIPALLVFLVIGMLAGSAGPGGIYFDDHWLAQLLGSVALTYILFAGGLDTSWSTVRPIWKQSALLSTIGVVLTAILLGAFAHLVLRFPLLLACCWALLSLLQMRLLFFRSYAHAMYACGAIWNLC